MTRRDVSSVDWIVAAGVLVVVTLLQWPLRLHMVSVADEGATVHMAADILRGRLPYVDGFHYVLPGVFYLTAAAFAVAGESMEVARALACLVFAIACGASYGIARWWYDRPGALVVVGLVVGYRLWAYPHWQMIGYAPLAIALVLVATWALGEATRRDRTMGVVLAGVVAGLAFLCKQDSGAAGGIALGLFALLGPPGARAPCWRHATVYAAGVLVPLLGYAGFVTAQGAAGETFHQTVRLALQAAAYGDTLLRRPDPWPLFARDMAFRFHVFDYLPPVLLDLHFLALLKSRLYQTTGLVEGLVKLAYWAPPVAIAIAGARVGWSWRALHAGADPRGIRGLLVVTLVALAARVAFSPPHDWIHLLVLYPPTLLLAAGLVAGVARHRRIVGGTLTALVGVALAVSAVLGLQLRRHFDTPLETERGTLYGTGAQVRSIRPLIDWLETRREIDTRLTVFPYIPLVNFLTGRASLTRYYVVWPAHVEPERDEEIVAALDASRDAQVVYSPSQFLNLPAFRDYAPRVFEHLVQHYEIARVFGGEPGGLTFLALERREHPTGTSLLGPQLDGATVGRMAADGRSEVVTRDERERLVGEASWPFARVLRAAVTPGERLDVRYALVPRDGDRFAAAYGVDPDRWQADPAPQVRFTLLVREEQRTHVLHEDEIAPRHDLADRRWHPVSADLDAWAGKPIELVLRVSGPSGARPPLPDAGWAWPRLEGPARP